MSYRDRECRVVLSKSGDEHRTLNERRPAKRISRLNCDTCPRDFAMKVNA
jgi:hypothetical protein